MSKCNIFCSQHYHNYREWEITSDGRVWPCCFYANAWDKRLATDHNSFVETQRLLDDDIFWQLLQQDPDFNNLTIHSFDNIISHPIFNKHIYFEGWRSETPPTICVAECKVKIDDLTGNQTTKAQSGSSWSHDLAGKPLAKDK